MSSTYCGGNETLNLMENFVTNSSQSKQDQYQLMSGLQAVLPIWLISNCSKVFYLMKIYVLRKQKQKRALSSYRIYNNNLPQYFSKEEFLALQNLCKNKNIAIQKSDNDVPVVIIFNKIDYLGDYKKI